MELDLDWERWSGKASGRKRALSRDPNGGQEITGKDIGVEQKSVVSTKGDSDRFVGGVWLNLLRRRGKM